MTRGAQWLATVAGAVGSLGSPPAANAASSSVIRAVGAHVAELDVLVAADQVGQAGDLHRESVIVGREGVRQPGDRVAVLGQQGAFRPPDLGPPERVERGAAQAAAFRSASCRGIVVRVYCSDE
jgi:hypothetical protein